MVSENVLRRFPWFVRGYLDGYKGNMSNVSETLRGSKEHDDYEAGYVKGRHDSIIEQCKK